MFTTLLSVITKVLDIAIVWFMIYQLLKYSKNNFAQGKKINKKKKHLFKKHFSERREKTWNSIKL